MSWPAFWMHNTWQTKLLSPLAKLVCWEATRRLQKFQQQPPLRQTQAQVIVVGNIVVGGSGKTPFIVWLTQQLQAQGLRVGIVSRGYGGNSKQWPLWVNAQSDPKLVGDEPVLLAKQLGCLIAVAPKRAQAIELLDQQVLLDNQAKLDVIISDDGLQHYAMARDIEVVLIDAQRQFGNQHCLPAGPLREPLNRLKQVDFCIWNGLGPAQDFPLLALNPLESTINSDSWFGKQPGHFKMNLSPLCFRQVMNPKETRTISDFAKQPAYAIAGIGNPQRFFETLQALEISITSKPFADHYAYRLADFEGFEDKKPLLMTEKDAVKCSEIAKIHQKTNWWYLEVAPICDKGDLLLTQLLHSLKPKLDGKHSNSAINPKKEN
ncbi:MAG: tetraacyldisaccharide 4'-kinase [Pseudomonadota bacterium]